ncbi:amidohydrolase [Caldithrix abyssi DSM 13497]|uniref:Amidohydrolase n=1 Tax=Caldithrix abyssi DSM 13497 TaxID=880073 RepID=H1XR16_CALAY|nr:amidohydrolase family protein [Caldithrix abyssi]APF20031.1 Cytosine/adenosine deaminase [Caldithrix abyssi DSM 13497]EHO40110.1 amidohydrolase [Caldithrix abyssi DSM 13497]
MKKKEAYCASWIVPVVSPPMREAALIVEDGVISTIVPGHELPRHAKNLKIYNFPNGVILPAWVNAHTHLELSYFKDETIPAGQFFEWVERLLAVRAQKENPQRVKTAALQQMRLMRQSGTALAGDITNGPLLEPLPDEPLERAIFYEILGFLPERAEVIFEKAQQELQARNPHAILTPHAPYSTSPHLLKKIASASARMSIHLAESKSEYAFLTEGSAELTAFLKARKAWPENWKTPGKTPVGYLNDLGLLHGKTLLVHGVQVTDRDLDILKNSGAAVCICARSNDRLNVGLPPIQKYLEKGIPLCIGTDSLASNVSLDLNDEIYYLWERFNQALHPVTLVRMATLNGARALGREGEFGSLEVGKKAAFNVFEFDEAIKEEPESAVVSRKWRRLRCF